MSFDGIMTRAIAKQLQETLTSGRISKVYQPHKTDLVFTIRANGRNHKLLLSANPSFARIHLTEHQYENPDTPPMFCMLLRKHLESAFIESIEQLDMERMIKITVKNRDEIGDETTKVLYVEIMGRHSNIILTDEKTGKIIDSIKHIPSFQNRHRTILPGFSYVLPPAQEKVNPFSIHSKEEFISKINWNEGKLDKQIVSTFSGLSPLIAKEIVCRAGLSVKEKVAESFLSIITQLNDDRYEPQMITNDTKEYFSIIELNHVTGEVKRFDDVSRLLDRYYYGKADRDRIKQQANDLEKYLSNEYDKIAKKIGKLNKELEQTVNAEEFQKKGELLTAYMYLAKKGDKEIEVEDYFTEEQPIIKIELDPLKNPADNAQSYFKKYAKLKKSVSIIKDQIDKSGEELLYFERLIVQMDSASMKDVEEIREELSEGGYLKHRQSKQKKKQKSIPKPEQFVSTDGTEILVGKNNKQNDYLTFKLSRANETWLHTKDIPGSHVVIKSDSPSETALTEAAVLAGFYSKAKNSSSVPVDFTLIKHVKKPNGSKPGFVIYDNQQTLYVTPDEDVVWKLKK
ncbi:NFACT RNA binding domain-containing protein [Bacillus sp. NEB1478]|uniref:Rqc2 family fibronectin-binding protein n=1 Tax=Bacillus sp. NEB1478 TaxID=3073816 RepID=UPI0028731CA7|nr:NFACT RNA binding domain-containing protein [Bacillus sp. NEB1478]WNB90459.1 NFACT RNA binding domain-containing protein [Bacillus sp. NEB1478]